ncbi:MAG: ABC transporter permease subunit [bacterium]|nr:ABC transporter permease subunit [bacterium]
MTSPVLRIAWHEFQLHRRNRWVVSFACLFASMTLLISYFGMVTSGYAGFQDFIRTAASLANLSGFVVPLFALLLGVFSFLTNREYLEILLTQPISRARVLLGKYFGLSLTVLIASGLGFGLPGIVIALAIGVEGAVGYLAVVLFSSVQALAFVGVAILIVLLARRRQIALGAAMGVWIFFELVYGMLMLGTTLYLPARLLKPILLFGLLGNPVDVARVLSLLQVGGPHLFGPAGATLVKLAGSEMLATGVGFLALLAWVVLPMALAIRIFARQDI